MTEVKAFAPAKINLTLHVTGQRADGYHLLDSLVVFADVGDWISVEHSDDLQLHVVGPKAAGVPENAGNLVLKAAHFVGVSDADITLEKHLPTASGIGGGSSDAAALLRALQHSHRVIILPDDVLRLGADVPVCLLARTARMSGIGEKLVPVDTVPPLPVVLINPGVAIHTPDVFQGLDRRFGAKMTDMPVFSDLRGCIDWLATQRNDLQEPAIEAAPIIKDVLVELKQSGARLARMSGSGATCFGIYETVEAATAAAKAVNARHPEWWIRPTILAVKP